MKLSLTKNSKTLLNFFIKNNCINHKNFTNKTKELLKVLYYQIKEADEHLLKINIKKQTKKTRIPIKPRTFNNGSFPDIIIKHIYSNTYYEISYNFYINERNITVYFILETYPSNEYDTYVKLIAQLMYILNIYSNKTCSRNLNIFIYMTSQNKYLPENNFDILDTHNVNTAFTRTCMPDAEIVIYRKEEWFKVLIHESFHNFGLDFSDMDNTLCHSKILDIFKVNSKINLFEAYTEFWAEILNSAFCSYIILINKNNINEFIININFFINFERSYSFFQLVKILNFMKLKYTDLYKQNNKYTENTNVLSYYIIKTILLHNFQDFLIWCKINNTSLIQFNKTIESQLKLCDFIKEKYNSKLFIYNIEKSNKLLMKCNDKFLKNNMRMTITELG